MGTVATVRVNTTQKTILYRDCIIQEVHEPGEGDAWEWVHEDYSHDREFEQATGIFQSIYECIDAVENWHDNRDEAAWENHQRSIMESGGPDVTSYRKDVLEAGRGHLLK